MKFYEIRFTSWRDQPAAKRPAKQATELAETATTLRQVEKDLTLAVDQLAPTKVEALKLERDRLTAARAGLLQPEEQEGFGSAEAALRHPMVGRAGYQVVDEQAMRVVRLVDESGEDLPASAVYEYELVEVDAAEPSWAAEKLALWFPKEDKTQAIQR